jgi:hypothetical protein
LGNQSGSKETNDFQNQNMLAMNTAQQAKDTAVINKLMQEFSKLQQEVGVASKQNINYAETHPKSYISVLIVQGMVNDQLPTLKKKQNFNSLEESLKD